MKLLCRKYRLCLNDYGFKSGIEYWQKERLTLDTITPLLPVFADSARIRSGKTPGQQYPRSDGASETKVMISGGDGIFGAIVMLPVVCVPIVIVAFVSTAIRNCCVYISR